MEISRSLDCNWLTGLHSPGLFSAISVIVALSDVCFGGGVDGRLGGGIVEPCTFLSSKVLSVGIHTQAL